MPRKLLVGGSHRSSSCKGAKKVAPPTVPSLQPRRSPCVCGPELRFDAICDADFEAAAPPPSLAGNSSFYSSSFHQSFSMKKMTPGAGSNGQIHLAHVIVHSQPDSLPSTPSDTGYSPSLTKGRLLSGTQASLEDQGIELSSPGRHSPGGSSGGSSVSRHSLSSLDSGRASAPGSDVKAVNRRLSIQSYEGSSPNRRSYHSSSSSIASAGEDILGAGPNVAEMILHGLPDLEILSNWLESLHFEEYIQLFLLAGYDMPTITRMTPEDLTAIGITKPNHRRKLKSEIAKLKIADGIPEYKPNSLLEWLQLLRLEEYYDTLCRQNYDTVDKVTDLTWEDLEDIGIQKLGHQKKILLAIKRIEDIKQGRRPNLVPQASCPLLPSELTDSGPATLPRPSNLGSRCAGQEVAIATQRASSPPPAAPSLKTFQQQPHRRRPAEPMLSPSRGRSLESLSTEMPLTASYTPAPPPAPAEPPKPPPRDWRTTDLDTGPPPEPECEVPAAATLPLRARASVARPRPVAKIAAKTREEIAEAIVDIPDEPFKSLIDQSRASNGWASLDGSPRHAPTLRGGSLKRPPPPPPPKRANPPKKEEEFPPPPAPLPSASVPADESIAGKDELFNNPLFLQRRKDSAEGRATAVVAPPPRQRPPCPIPPAEPPKAATTHRREFGSQRGKRAVENHSSSNHQNEYDRTPEAISPGDVIDDIENMLANLSDQLDAMLDNDQAQK